MSSHPSKWPQHWINKWHGEGDLIISSLKLPGTSWWTAVPTKGLARGKGVENPFGAPNGAWFVRKLCQWWKLSPRAAMNHFQCRNRSPTKRRIESSPQLFHGKIEKLIIKTMTQNTMFPFFCALSCTTYPQWPIPSRYLRIAHARHQPLTLDQPMEPYLSTRHDCIDCISLRVACINSLLFGCRLAGQRCWESRFRLILLKDSWDKLHTKKYHWLKNISGRKGED